ncbi:MAG: 3-mercaptopyruvate sulfurtransferase [Pseudorhodoplanes sp.]
MTIPASRQNGSRWLVSTDQLAERMSRGGVAIVDGSWYLPQHNRQGFEEYLAGHIPGAVFFDIDEISDHSSDLPHMLPPVHTFELHMARLGIANDMDVVVYDGMGLFSAPRVWWTLRLFGLKNVYILDGGFPKWKKEGRPIEKGMPKILPADFSANFDASLVADYERVKQTLADHSAQVVDSRPANRFTGEAPEPREGVASGHMPGSLNLPASELIENGALASPEKIEAAATKAGMDLSKPVITSCGSGVSAAVLWLALDSIGKPPKALYDGSWSDWGTREDAAIETGPAKK